MKLCPKCELNYIQDEEDCCVTCLKSELIKKYKKDHGKLDIEFLNRTYPDTLTWRKELVKLGLYSDLEEIDIDQHIKYAK